MAVHRCTHHSKKIFRIGLIVLAGLAAAILSPQPVRAQGETSDPVPLQLRLQNDVDFIEPGQTLAYQLRLQNDAPGPAQIADLRIILPQELDFLAASLGGTQHPTATGVIAWPAFQLDAARATTRTVTVRARLPISTASATVDVHAAATVQDETDPPSIVASVSDPLRRAAVTGEAWHDLNGDGIRNETEPGLAGLAVQITTQDRTLPLLNTDADGAFRQTGLGQGTYDVTLLGATLDDFPLRTAAKSPITLTLVSGMTEILQFGYAQSGAISGQVWREDSGTAGRQPLAETLIMLQADDGSTAATIESGPSGAFQFTDVPPGAYRVVVDPTAFPPGFAGISEADGSLDQRIEIELLSGAAVTGVDFGVAFSGAIKQGLIWRDGNENGRVDPGEPGIAGVAVEARFAGADNLFETGDDGLHSATTDATGTFAIADLTPGPHRVRTVSATWNPRAGVTADPDGTLDAQTEVVIVAGQTIGPLRFGYGPHDLALTASSAAGNFVPGEFVRYRLDYANRGSVEAGDAWLRTVVPPATRFVAAESAAWSCPDGSESGVMCDLRLGVLSSGQAGGADFVVRLSPVMPAGVNTITQTAMLSDTVPGWLDDRAENDVAITTVTVTAAPRLSVDIEDGGGVREPGDSFSYQFTYGNEGNQHAADAVLAFVIPAHTRFDPAASEPGWQCAGNGASGATCGLTLGELPAGTRRTANIGVTIAPAVPVNVARIEAIITLRDGAGGTVSAAELTPLDAAPDLQVQVSTPATSKQPGMSAAYDLIYANVGNQDAIGVLLIHTVPEFTTFNGAESSPGWDCPDGSPAATRCIYTLGTLAAGETDSVRFAVTIDPDLPPGVEEIRNSVVIVGAGVEQDVVNNQDGGVISVTIQSSVDLIGWSATGQADGTMLIRWETGAERDAWGFLVYRGVDNDWRETERITPALVSAQGTAAAGAVYTVVDRTAQAGVRYRYWLQEIALDNSTVIYGPLVAELASSDSKTSGTTLYFPLITQN